LNSTLRYQQSVLTNPADPAKPVADETRMEGFGKAACQPNTYLSESLYNTKLHHGN
jgi:hypothetical protein